MSLVSSVISKVGYRLFPDGSTTIGSTTNPTETEVIAWINETVSWILGVCAEENSQFGRTLGSITTEDGTGDYDDLTDMYCPGFLYDQYGEPYHGFVLKTNVRNPLRLVQESEIFNRDPAAENEPDCYYISGSYTVNFLDTPNDEYTVKIPYYQIQDALTATTDTMPFGGYFDDLIVEAVVLRELNREEYETPFETQWMQFVLERARRMIRMRERSYGGVKLA